MINLENDISQFICTLLLLRHFNYPQNGPIVLFRQNIHGKGTGLGAEVVGEFIYYYLLYHFIYWVKLFSFIMPTAPKLVDEQNCKFLFATNAYHQYTHEESIEEVK